MLAALVKNHKKLYCKYRFSVLKSKFLDKEVINMAYFADFGGQKYANLTMAVGGKEVGTSKPAANTPTDMMLVYFFLYSIGIMRKTSVSIELTSFIQIPPRKVDWFSAATKSNLTAAIKAYQTYRRTLGFPIFPDGRVDSIPGGRTLSPGAMGVKSSITNTIYTIGALNDQYLSSGIPSSWQPEDLTVDIAMKNYHQDVPKPLYVELFHFDPDSGV